MTNIVLCGGVGSRLWPLSRTSYPKQFFKLDGSRSLIQETIIRNSAMCENIMIVTGESYYFLAKDQLGEIQPLLPASCKTSFLLESIPRNTAPALLFAALLLPESELALVTPADHTISGQAEYENACAEAARLALDGNLVVFGVPPASPETGYGYIRAEGTRVLGFTEKPSLETAERYLRERKYFWNAGILCARAGTLLEEIRKFEPALFEAGFKALERVKAQSPFRIGRPDMEGLVSTSIDYAVLEKSQRIAMVKAGFSWSDMGGFEALYQYLPKDADGNAAPGDVIADNSRNNLVVGADKTIALADICDSIIINTPDILFLAKKSALPRMKEIVKTVMEARPSLVNDAALVYRPWGSYAILMQTPHFKIKKISVAAGKRLSLQRHKYRNEHWVVVSGRATIILSDKTMHLTVNESTYIPAGESHRLANEQKEELEIIEVQIGSYVGEDDIERLSDDFERIY